MTETLDPMAAEVDQKQLAEQLLAQAKEHGVELMGPNGLLNQLAKNVLALDAEMTEHLGYDRHDSADRGSGKLSKRYRSKTVFIETVPVEIGGDRCPRDIDSSFAPQIVKKRQRRLAGIDEIVLSLSAKGITTGKCPTTSRTSMGQRSRKTQFSGLRTEAFRPARRFLGMSLLSSNLRSVYPR